MIFCFVPWDSSPWKTHQKIYFGWNWLSKHRFQANPRHPQGSSRRLEAEANSGSADIGPLENGVNEEEVRTPEKLTWNLKNPTLEDDFPIGSGSMYTYVYTQFLCSKWNWSKCFKWNGMQKRWRFVLGYKWSFTYFSRSTWMFQRRDIVLKPIISIIIS